MANRTESQKTMIKRHLLSDKSITPYDALRMYGCFRLAAIIHTLRHTYGMDIEMEMVDSPSTNSKFGKYNLKKKETVTT